MTLNEKLNQVLHKWSGGEVDDDGEALCDLWLRNNAGIKCSDALPSLVKSLRSAFPSADLSDLRPDDLKADGNVSTVGALAEYIATHFQATVMNLQPAAKAIPAVRKAKRTTTKKKRSPQRTKKHAGRRK